MFEPSALYVLAQTRRVPPAARAHAVQLAESGERITHAVAVEIVAAHKEPAFAGEWEERAFAKELAARTEPLRRDGGPGGAAEAAGERLARLAELGDALARLAAECSTVHVTTIDEDEDGPLYSVTTYQEDAGPRNAVRADLLGALQAVAGREPEKVCPTCKGPKPVSQFGALQGAPGGRNRCCKACERARIADVKRRKKAKSPAAPPAA